MTRLIILGTAWAVPSPNHANTHMAIERDGEVVLIDCPGSPSLRLTEAGIPLTAIKDVIITHFHPDHVGGVPLMLMNMWLLGRQEPLRIYGLHHCLERVEDMMGFFHWDNWPEFFPVAFHRLPEREHVLVMEKSQFRVFSSPVRHVVPTIGLRIEAIANGRVVTYSCDTEPCPSVVRLAEDAHILVHEATGSIIGHTSASQAGAIAQECGVERLLLIHYKAGQVDLDSLVEQAKETFEGEVALATDLMQIEL